MTKLKKKVTFSTLFSFSTLSFFSMFLFWFHGIFWHSFGAWIRIIMQTITWKRKIRRRQKRINSHTHTHTVHNLKWKKEMLWAYWGRERHWAECISYTYVWLPLLWAHCTHAHPYKNENQQDKLFFFTLSTTTTWMREKKTLFKYFKNKLLC